MVTNKIQGQHLFRINKSWFDIIISEDVKNAFEEAGVIGCKYKQVTFDNLEENTDTDTNNVVFQEEINYYDLKNKALEHILGKRHDSVGHSIIPFEFGGAVNMNYFLEHIAGTACVTTELLHPESSICLSNDLGTYELIAFTKEKYNHFDDCTTPFFVAERRICHILTSIADFSAEKVFNPNETYEILDSDDNRIFLLFENYEPNNIKLIINEKVHHLLLCIKIFEQECLYAREFGVASLVDKLKENESYPYSDLDRFSVV